MNPDVERIIQEAAPLNGEPNAPTGAPFEIDATIGDLDVITRLAWHVIEIRNVPPHLFLHGTLPCRIECDERGAPRLVELTVDRLRYELARSATWTRRQKRNPSQQKETRPPLDVVKNMLATPDLPLPPITRIVETPVFAKDGELVSVPGYQPASRLYLAPYDPALNLSTPAHPSATDVQWARNLISEVLKDFPFVADADRAHAVGLLVVPFARDLIHGLTPNHVIEAPSAGTGKTLLADAVLLPSLGRHVPRIAEVRNDEEWRKRLTAHFKEGRPVLLLDNLSRPMVSGVVSNALTTTHWEDRLLGRNEMVRVPVRTIWVMTANNVALSLEIARRSVRIRLDAKTDRPWLRAEFGHPDLLAWAEQHRADLIRAALVLIQAWLNAGRPNPKARPLGSFEAWTHVVGGIVEHAGFTEFLSNALEFYEAVDSEGAAWRLFVELWWANFQEEPVTVKDLLGIADQVEGVRLGRGDSDRSRLTALGMGLRNRRDQVIGVYRIEAAGKTNNASRWRLSQCESAPAAVPVPDEAPDEMARDEGPAGHAASEREVFDLGRD